MTTPQYNALAKGANNDESPNLVAKRAILEAIAGNLEIDLDAEEVREVKLLRQKIELLETRLDALEHIKHNISKANHLNSQGYVMVKYEDNDPRFYWGGSKQGWIEEIEKAKIYPSEGECNRFLTPMQKKNPSLNIRRAKLSELSG
ncbi:MAG: hypothetical protein ACRC80_08275 [Waterburya sp.]